MEVTMGGGEYVGNASVHWSVDHEDGQKFRVKQDEPRRPRNGDQHNVSTDGKVFGRDAKSIQNFDVTLRFESKADARAQLQAALAAVDAAANGTSFFLSFKVPATVNGMQRTDPDMGPRPDVGVHW
jgi:hypothetical protein